MATGRVTQCLGVMQYKQSMCCLHEYDYEGLQILKCGTSTRRTTRVNGRRACSKVLNEGPRACAAAYVNKSLYMQKEMKRECRGRSTVVVSKEHSVDGYDWKAQKVSKRGSLY